MTNSWGCVIAKNMEEMIKIHAASKKESYPKALIEFQNNGGITLETDGPTLCVFDVGIFDWYQLKMVEHLDADFINKMEQEEMTLEDIMVELENKTGQKNYIMSSVYLGEEGEVGLGDSHAFNIKKDEKRDTYFITDQTKSDPWPVGWFYQEELLKQYSISIYYWEKVETTAAWKEQNSRGVSA